MDTIIMALGGGIILGALLFYIVLVYASWRGP